MEISIRPYEEADRLSLLNMATKLMHQMSTLDSDHLFRSTELFDAEAYIDCRLKLLKKSQGKIFVAQIGKKLVGYVMCAMEGPSEIDTLNKIPCRVGNIEALFIEPSEKGKGLGTKLMAQAEKYLKDLGATHCGVGCLSENTDGKTFYEHAGYHPRYIDYFKQLP